MNWEGIEYLVPELFLCAASLALLIVATFTERDGKTVGRAALATLAVTFVLVHTFGSAETALEIYGGMFRVDAYATFFKSLFLIASFLTILFSFRFLEGEGYTGGEYYGLILFATLGMMFMVAGSDLVSIYVGLELMALSAYVLVGYFKRDEKSIEAAMKYFILGAFSSGVLLYGISLVYGSTGKTSLQALAAALRAGGPPDRLLLTGVILLACGLFFKVAAVPFHVWTPDVYEGAPTPVTAFLSTASKAASFAIFLRIFGSAMEGLHGDWAKAVAVVAASTILLGNFAALTQENVKRLLAYSSIAHAGYALLGLLALNEFGIWGVIVYMMIYTFMNLGAFGIVILLKRKGFAGDRIEDFNGLAARHPLAAFAMLVFLLSLAGVPPTAGYVGKLYLFSAVLQDYAWLAILAVLMSAVSLYYYFKIVVAMYFRDADREPVLSTSLPMNLGLAACLLATVAMGVYPEPFIKLAKASMKLL